MPSNFKQTPSSVSSITGNIKILEEAARSMRRMKANEEYNDEGVRTIWHRGRGRLEMLSWEDKSGEMVKQELSFFGMVVEFKVNRPVRTGAIPDDGTLTDSGKPKSHLVKMDEVPKGDTLDYASHLLKAVGARDYYAQHLLKEINDTIAAYGFDEARTAVSRLDEFRTSSPKKVPTPDATQKLPKQRNKEGLSPIIKLFLLAIVGLGLGVGAGLFFLR